MQVQFKLFILLGIALIGYAGWHTLGQPEFREAAENTTQPKSITVLVGGDVNMGRLTGQNILAGDIDFPFRYIADTLKNADITFVNLESQLADLGGETESPTSEYRFAGPPDGAVSLANAGIDIVSVANNHMWDYGKAKLKETLDNLRNNEVLYVGASMDGNKRFDPAVLEIRGKKIAFLAMTNLLNGYENVGADDYISFQNPDAIVAEIEKLKVRSDIDWILVSLHSGAEYIEKPTQNTVNLAKRFIDAGADAILGHHPHVPLPIDVYNKKPIFYSLGNFAFWQPFGFWTENSFLAKLILEKPHEVKYEIIPIDAGWQPELLTDEESINKLLSRLNS